MSANNRHFALFGCGFLGREVASQAADHGFRLTALTRNSEDAERLRKIKIPAVVSELRSSSWHEKIDPNPDAALISVNSGKGGPEGYRKSWIEGLQSVLDWSRSCGRIENLIFISS